MSQPILSPFLVIRRSVFKWLFTTVVLFVSACSAFSQIDTSKMAWPPGMTQKQKVAYMKYFGNFQHPDEYYSLPVAKQRQFDVAMHKHKSLRSRGFIMAGVGLAFIGVGAAIPDNSDSYTNVIFYGIGGAMVLGSIPLFVSSGKRGREAQLIIQNTPPATSFLKFRPQVGLRLLL